jgi:hypothetical protein
MVFAVPITLIIIILIQNDEELRWVNTLLGVDQLFEEGRHEKTKQGAE